MMSLKESILSREQGIYRKVWETKEDTVKFLKSNGYVDCTNDIRFKMFDKHIVERSRELGMPVYVLGNYDSDPITHWIRVFDYKKDKRTIFFWRDKEIDYNLRSKGETCGMYMLIDAKTYDIREIEDLEEFKDIVRDRLGL